MTSVTKANFANEGEFNQLLSNEKLVVADYSATWCGPCRVVAPLIDRLASEYSDRATVIKIDIDENKDIAKKYGIRSIPAVLVFRDGEVVESLFGSKPYETYSNILETQLKL
ncbi:thioredoxin [Pleurocapsa sp. FMAR1]|uniref:thioredoxin n=1 Tax=Pleurocapsa sp. FMAR1 TaxID=3040204 RepID=UPI0029C7D114|nr:thioredoxin [Pleurocapsa sp. FMAR1]